MTQRQPPRPTTLRACLRCRKPFNSEGAWNRICIRCAQDNRAISMRLGRVNKMGLANGGPHNGEEG